MAMEWRQFALLLLVALAGKVTRGQQPAATVASCFAGTGCSGSVVSQNTIWRDCCQGSAPAQSFVGINGQCRDCSELVVEFAATSYTVSEGAEFVTLEVVKWGETTNEIILNFTLGMEGDSAEGGDDFGPFPEPVVSVLAFLPSNDTTLSFGVQLREDSIVESTESFTVRLELTSLLPLPPGLQLGLNEATVTIIDNDVVNVTVLPENLVVNVEEGQQQLTFTLIRSGQTVRDVTVMVRTQPGSAQDPEDFVSHSELVSFAVLEEVRTISITVNDDSIVESTEEFFVLLEVPPDETGVMIPQSSSSVFIIDNDRLTLGFTSAVSSVSEATGSISVEVTKVGMNERPVAVAFSTQNGTATDTEDFTAVQGILEFGPEDTLPILINVSMDGIFEDEDSFTITLSVPVNETGVILGQATSTVTIFDSDSVTVGFEVNTLDVSEEVGVVVIQVSLLEGVLARDIDVQLDCISGQATAGEDFSCPAMTFTFNDNISEQNVSIGVEDDGFFEGTENFVVTLQSPVFGVQIEPAVVDITISDNEDLRIRFDQEVYSVSETENSVEVTVILNVSLNRPLEVFLVTVDGTATGGSDYVSLNQTLRFTSSVLQQRAQITLTDDILNDGVEFFLLQLLPASDDLGAFRSLAEATVEIEDNERIIIEFGQTTYTVDEGDRFVSLIMTKSGVTLQDFLVQVTLEDRSALGGRDYGPFPDPMIQINALMLANDTEIVIGILIREDAIIEDTESFVASLQVSPGTFPGNNTNATVYILDNDVVDITLTPETITVDERDGSVTFTVSRDRDTVLNRAVTILFMTESGSASSGFDFDSVVQILTFTSDVNELSVSVPINNDFIAEGLEQFSAILSGEPEPAARIVQNTSTVFIADDDVVQVEFDRVEYSVSEDAEFVSINVLKTGQSAIAITVEVATADGTATAPFDYNATVTEVTFETFDTERVVSFQLIDDAVFEGDEVFFVNLSAQNSEDPIMLGNRTTARITITENDFVVIQFAVSAYTVDEIDGIVVITVIKQMNNSRPVTVMLLTEPGTATAPLDYGAVAMDIEFQPGAEEQQSIDILIIDDVFNERTEFFTARLEVPSAETGVILGSINMSSITIIDNDPLGVGFELASYTVIEGGAVQVCISQQGNSMRAVNVTVATRAGTAIGGVDFQTKIGILSLEPPATQVCCDIQTLPDSQQESVEMFEVVLLQASEGVSIFRDTAIVSITDRNCSLIIAIEQETYRVGEGDASAVTVCVTTESEVVVQAELATLPSVDPGPPLFNSTTNLLNFQPPGDRECCTIPLNNNEIGLEGERSFGVLLSVSSSIPGVLCIGTSEATVVVTDDDNVIVEFASANYTANEADGALLVCVRKNRDTAIDFSVTIMPTESSPPQAEESSDFDPSPRSISLDAQESVACTSITIISDGIPEGAEIFIVQLELPEIMGLQLGPISEAIVTIIDGPSTPSPPTPVLGNDTVIGDPLFTVPLRLTSASQSLLRNIIRRRLRNRLPNLCYEIHGSAGSFFNLVSDVCTSVNAFYTSANISQDLNVITAIGIRAVNLRQSCIDIRISVEDDCMPSVTEPGGQEFSTSQYNSDGISVSRFGQKVRVVVPNCENVDLVMWITCREVNSNRMMRFVITRGVNLRPTSHGFLGQFWNVPINVERFVPTREDPYFLEEELFVITVNPMDSQQRRFVAELYDQVWDTTLGVCFYAGSIQAGPVAEIDEPNDSVIQGVYSDYHVSGLFDSEFMYSQFSDSRCT